MTGLTARNPAVQHLRRLSRRRSARQEANAFVIDGPVLLGDALDAGIELDAVFIEERARHEAWATGLLERCDTLGVRRLEVAEGVLATATDTVTPQPIAAIGRMVTRPLRFFTATPAGFVLVLAGVNDPGNAGTILRSAEAAGAKGVVMGAGSVDLYNPKTVRASAGSLFRVPVAVPDDDTAGVLSALADAGFAVLGTVAGGGRSYDEIDLTGPVALVLGNEARGLSTAVDEVLTERVSIPMVGATDSLNVAMAATVISFEVARQCRHRAADT